MKGLAHVFLIQNKHMADLNRASRLHRRCNSTGKQRVRARRRAGDVGRRRARSTAGNVCEQQKQSEENMDAIGDVVQEWLEFDFLNLQKTFGRPMYQPARLQIAALLQKKICMFVICICLSAVIFV